MTLGQRGVKQQGGVCSLRSLNSLNASEIGSRLNNCAHIGVTDVVS